MKVKEIIKFTEWMPNPQKTVETPKFSIMMPTYRRFASGHLTRAIQSVLNQDYQEFELIMIDDGSVDGSFDEIQRFMKLDPRIHCLRHPLNVGLPAIGCYEAFLKSHGEYLMFCFDDTEYQDKALEKVAKYVALHKPKIAFGYIDYPYMNLNGNIAHAYLGRDKISQTILKMTNFLPNLGAVLHRDVPNEIGFLDPHLAITRLTDWDYWRRAAKVLELHYSGIHIGTEFGLVTGNSLGLTNPINLWMAYEWMERNRDQTLTPGKYEEYDVQEIPDEFSDQSKLTLQDISRFYQDKFWYSQEGTIKISNHISSDSRERNTKILVLTGVNDASVTLYFEFMPQADKNIRIVSPYYFDYQEMINASAVVISRHLFSTEIFRWVEVARQLGIPHYYYLDDNFVVLKNELAAYKEYTIENFKKELGSFHGILVSTQALANFFAENNLHPKVHIFPPVAPPEKWLDRSLIPQKTKGTTRIGFMGGLHRQEEFMKYVLPAVARLAKEQTVELVIGGDLRISLHEYPQLKIYQFPFNLSYRLALGRMQSADIDILVHAGSMTHNNPYKSLNVLLNAWVLKALPILANQPPYEDVEKLGLGLLSNNAEDWYENLKRAVSEPILASQIQEKLNHYIIENFSGTTNLEVLKLISAESPSPGASVIDNRYRLYIDIVKRGGPQSINLDPNTTRAKTKLEAIARKYRLWLLPANSPQERFARLIFRKFFSGSSMKIHQSADWNPLMAQGTVNLVRRLEYTLRPQAPKWTGFEFMIGTHQKRAFGQIEIEIANGATKDMLRHQTLELYDIEDNQVIQINFEAIENSKDVNYLVRFLLKAPGPETVISIYEANETESRIKQILRKLGLLTRGNILACRLHYSNQ